MTEKERLKNIAENEKLLQELGIAGGGSEIIGAAPKKLASTDAAKRKRKRTQTTPKPAAAPQRLSARLQGVKAEAEAFSTERASKETRHEDLDLTAMTRSDMDEQETKRLQNALSVTVPAKQALLEEPKTDLEALLRSMRLSSYARVAEKRIYSMLYHPTLDKDLVFTGDQDGVLGIWDALAPTPEEDNDGNGMSQGVSFPLQLHAHFAIACLRMDPCNHDRIYASSYDTSVRVFSLASQTSSEVWAGRKGVQLGEFAILAPQQHAFEATPTPVPQLDERSLWIADHRGGLLHIETRSMEPTARRWQVSEKKIGGMAVNPAVPYCIATASNDRTVRMFDVRMLRNVPETPEAPVKVVGDDLDALESIFKTAQLDARGDSAACTSVDFSPTGECLAGVCYNDTVNLWDIEPAWLSHKNADEAHRTSASTRQRHVLAAPRIFPHNNQTGRWVTLFRARWNTNTTLEPHFSIGSMMRDVEIYGKDGRRMATLYDPDWITAIPAVTCMHPVAPARLAAGNGSGRCNLWIPKRDE
ncbi:hypothetical protein MVES1_003881 [Malassezia vespertilionis]|uniref:uncharacterized protein n=1 Tax=Malassezia vespertilionis TaxID=2020962 RepID=UPI0024B1E9D3|nr:uncharacterized protein MVES1_003881 [Malassezia vespertilionis]WFD08505.1 hypothetical protein MVES1_003881 [Malassezia vespertilionis]